MKFYNLGEAALKPLAADTLAAGIDSMRLTNEPFYASQNATNKPITVGSKYFSFCPPLVKLWIDIAGMSYPT